MSIRLVRSVRLPSLLRTTFAVTSKLTLFASRARLVSVCRDASANLRLAAVLLIAFGALCLSASTQTAHFSGARFTGVNGTAGAPSGDTLAGRNAVRMQATSAGNFGTVNVGSTGSAMSLTFTFDAAAVLGSVSVLTQGVPNLDFADAGTGSCKAGNSYSSGDTCTVEVTFTPTLAGTRYGGVVLYDSSGNALATGYVRGTGSGPQVNFLPGTESTFGSDAWTTNPCCVALDGAGNIYVGANNQMFELTPSENGYSSNAINVNGRSGPLAIDGAGNFYINTSGAIYKETPSAGGYLESTVVGGLYETPGAPAIDGSGNVFVAQRYQVFEEALSASGYTGGLAYQCPFTGWLHCYPSAVAVDGGDDVFFTRFDENFLTEETPPYNPDLQNTIYGAGTLFYDNLNQPSAIVADGRGDLYIADTVNNRVVEETLSRGGYNQSVMPTGSSLSGPLGVAVDLARQRLHRRYQEWPVLEGGFLGSAGSGLQRLRPKPADGHPREQREHAAHIPRAGRRQQPERLRGVLNR
ncbi:MAG: hypothetical protein WBE76_21010 [Terracidiphilus sp.]